MSDAHTNPSDTVSSILTSWGFEKYVDVFLENEVDLEALELLNNDQIRTLIPAIGPQAKFKKKLNDWTARQPVTNSLKQNVTEDISNFVSIYGESVGGLTPSLTSPIAPASPSSYVSGVSSISAIDVCEGDLVKLLGKTQDGQLLLKQGSEPLGDHFV